MKKVIFLFAVMLATAGMMGVSSCKGCASGEPKGTPGIEPASMTQSDYDGVVQDFTAGVEHIQALHRETMFSLIGNTEYQWRNSKVLFNDTITMESIDDLKVVEVTDVFFYWDAVKGPQVQYIASNVAKGTIIFPTIQDVWIEDANLSDKQIKLTVNDVLERLKQWNGMLPPAICMSLRYPVGPCECNAQWVIGDEFDVIFVDAVTGEISNWCPAFNPSNKPKGGDFGKPLGEWP